MNNSTYQYNYFNDINLPIIVNQDTINETPYSFQSDGTMQENNSIYNFFKLISPNDDLNIIDIGAQTGLYSLYAKYLPKCKFYSFEPFITTYNILNQNLILNDINNVNTYNTAISDKIGKSNFNICLDHNGLHTLGNNLKRFSNKNTIEVDTTTIDEIFFKNDIPVNYIKIDTEGYEYYILKGGINTIQKYKPIIQIEWNQINMSQCDVSENDLRELIKYLNYEIFDITDEEVLIRYIK